MKCKKCETPLDFDDLKAEVASDESYVEVYVECSQCETRHYTFIKPTDLVTS